VSSAVRSGALATLALLWLACAACERDAPSSDLARRAEPPRRILSLAPSATEILFAVGAGPQVVGVDAYSDYPPAARGLPRLGGLLDPDVEGMLRLRPDLVILLPSQAEVARALTTAGVPTLTVPHETLDDVERAILAIGERTGHAVPGRALADSLRRALARSRAAAGRRADRPRVLFVIAREAGELGSFSVAGPGTYLDQLIALAGAENALRDAPTRYPQVSAETALRLAPDVILEWTPNDTSAGPAQALAADGRRAAEWRGLFAAPAGRAPAVHILHDDVWVRSGPRVVAALGLLERLLAAETLGAARHG
jgi:iron complex transport system substrate-binding protein